MSSTAVAIQEPKRRRPADFVSAVYCRLTTDLILPVVIVMALTIWSVRELTEHEAPGSRPLSQVVNEDNLGEDTHAGHQIGVILLTVGVIIVGIILMTFLMVCLYKYNCMKLLIGWLIMSAACILFIVTWLWVDLVCVHFQIPYEFFSIIIVLLNFAVVGVISLFWYGPPRLMQGHLIFLSAMMAWFWTRLPEWTTWVLLVALAIYDLISVLYPKGPLHMLLAESEKGDKKLVGFVYDANNQQDELADSDVDPQDRAGGGVLALPNSAEEQARKKALEEEAKRRNEYKKRLFRLYQKHKPEHCRGVDLMMEKCPKGAEENMLRRLARKYGPEPAPDEVLPPVVIEDDDVREDPFRDAEYAQPYQLGLGDFVFYAVLVGRAAEYSDVSWLSCAVCVLVGMVGTLSSLVFYRGDIPAVPALPISIFAGVIFYWVGRFTFVDYHYWGAAVDRFAF